MRRPSQWLAACGSLAILLAAPSAVHAQEQGKDTGYEEEGYGYEPQEKTADHLITDMGTAVMVGGGGTGFGDADTREFAETGGSWAVQVVLGTRRALGLQLTYEGSVQGIDAIGLDSSANLLSNGIDATLRWNVLSTFASPLNVGLGVLEPYFLGGVGWRRYGIINSDFNNSNIQNNDDVGQVPFGGGVAWLVSGFVLDVWGSYTFAFEDNLIRDANANLDRWGAGARVGFEF